MKFKTVMILKAIVCLGFGPLLLFIPEWLLNLLGTSAGPSTLTAREYGSALIGNLFLTWLGRNSEDCTARRAIIWYLFVYDGIALVVTLWILLSGGLNALGWSIVAVYLFFALAFGYLLLPKSKTI